MMTTLLPKDADNNVIQALRFKDNGAHIITATASSARNVDAFDAHTKVISLYASVPVYIAFGDETVTATATDHYFPAGVYYDVAISGGTNKSAQETHLAVLRVADDGAVYISEKA